MEKINRVDVIFVQQPFCKPFAVWCQTGLRKSKETDALVDGIIAVEDGPGKNFHSDAAPLFVN